MYQHSLSYFTALFNRCIDSAARSEDLRARLVALMATTTELVYKQARLGGWVNEGALLMSHQ
jgi:hypothetical protein